MPPTSRPTSSPRVSSRAIEDLNRAGKMAFDGDAVQIARFNKDILLRARKARAQAEVAAAEVV